MERCRIFGIEVDRLDRNEAARWALGAAFGTTPRVAITLNPEMVERARRDSRFLATLKSADLVVPDGIGIVWACKMLSAGVPGRVAGVDLMTDVIERGAACGMRVFLLGAKPGVAQKAADELQKRYRGIDIVGTHHGYFAPEEEPVIIERIKAAAPHALFVGIGGGRGENWCVHNRDWLRIPFCMGVGGSFDVIAGEVRRAPKWAQNANLEWLYRLLSQPSRLGRQSVLFTFALRVLAERLRGATS